MSKLKIKWRRVVIAIWILLSIPTVYMYVAYTHDTSYIMLFDEVYSNSTGEELLDKSFITPYDLFNLYDVFLMMPHMVYNEKHVQMGIYEGYNETEDLTLMSAILSLEDEMLARWDFVYHKDEFKLWSLPNDVRLFELTAQMLDLTFVNQEEWQKMEVVHLDERYWNRGPLGPYAGYAEVLGYDNIDTDSWEVYISKMFLYYHTWMLLYLIFLAYSAIMFSVIIFRRIRRYVVKRNAKNKR